MRPWPVIAYVAAIGAAGAGTVETPVPLADGDVYTRELHGSDVHVYAVTSAQPVRIVVENLGRGTILTVTDPLGATVLRAANWRQSEGLYSAVFTPDGPVTVSIASDEPISPPGRYRLSFNAYSRDQPAFAAERAMTVGADALLKHYYGEADERDAALDHYLSAERSFRLIGDRARRADALFEVAGVYFDMGEHEEAEAAYASAFAIWKELGDARGMASAEVQLGLIDWRQHRLASAIAYFRRAASRRRALGDRYFLAQAINDIGLVYRDSGDARSAIEQFRQALQTWQGSVDLLNVQPSAIDFDRLAEAPWLSDALIALDNLAWANELLADTATTESILLRALELSEYLGRDRIAAEIRNNLGRVKYKTGDLQEALDYLDSSIAYFESAARDEIWAANVYQTRSSVFRASGDLRRAQLDLRAALELRTPERSPLGRARTLLALAELELESDDARSPLQHIQAALSLLDEHGDDTRIRAKAVDLEGQAHQAAGESELAALSHGRAIGLYRLAGDVRGEATARANRALSLAEQGRVAESLADLEVALGIARTIEDKLLAFRILTNRAGVYYLANRYPDASEAARSALALSAAVRDELTDPILLRYFSSVQRNAYDVLVNVALEEGDAAGAWRAANDAKARRLAELTGADRPGLSGLGEQQRRPLEALVQMRAARAEELTLLLASTTTEDQEEARQKVDDVRAELAGIVREIGKLQRSGSPVDGTAAEAPDLERLQASLGARDVVLEYYLGPRGSIAWRIDRENVVFQRLPAEQALARHVTLLVDAVRHRKPLPGASLAYLSRTLLSVGDGSVADAGHLIVIPDGVLYLLPFSMLPGSSGDMNAPLIAASDLSFLPSLAVLADSPRSRSGMSGDVAMPAASTRRESWPPESIAVLADPVFTREDARVRQAHSPAAPERRVLDADLTRSVERNRLDLYPRLPGTREEAHAIRAAAGDAEVFLALDTEASRDLVLSGALNRFRVLHFATHGILDAEEPSLSGLVLSGVTPDGQLRPRFLRSQDIASLALQADLVVLSGCETGLGSFVYGEGIAGLSQAFLRAGARQVVSSLWRIPDQATAVLMGHFYREMYGNGLRPAPALRAAQDEMRRSRRWRDPYYWAGFVIQGDWR